MAADTVPLIDARGLKCPLPVLKLEKALSGMPPGAEILVLADDPVARIDIPLLCRKHGHACTITRHATHLGFTVVKSGQASDEAEL